MSPRTKNPWVSVGVALMIAISLNSMSYTWAQTSTSNTTVSSDSGEASSPDTFLQRPIDKAMDPLYKMTNYFLQLVKGNTGITEYVDELERSGLEVVKRDNQTDYFATLQSSAFMLRLSTEWGQTVQWFIAYTVCIAVGILFMIIMPIVGCCVCCCRCCCKKCGGKVDPMEPKNAKCRRVVFGLVLAVITTLMLGGMVCAFVTNELMQEQTNHNNNDTGLLNSISKEIGRIDDYLSNTLTEINTTVISSYNGAKFRVIEKIEEAADTALDKIGTATNASEVIDKAKELAESVDTLAANLETVKTDTEALSNLTIQLDGELADVRQNISDTLSSCPLPECNATRSQLDSLETGANFTSLTIDALQTIKEALGKVRDVKDKNISSKVEQGEQEYNNISVKAREQLENEINNTKVELKKLDEKLGATLVDLSAQTKTFSGPVNDVRNSITSASDAITLYGKYRWYAGIGLSCILLLIVLFNYLGLAFGACGEPPDDDAHMCNTGVGANLLLAGVGFTFIFCSLLMLITMILFLVGSVSHNWVCLPTDPTNPNAEGYKLADGILASNNVNLSVSDGIKGCKEDKALYTAFQLDKLVPIDRLLAPVTAQIDDQIEKLKSIDLSSAIDQNIRIIGGELEQQMNDFANAGIGNISFSEFFNQTDKALTAIDLGAFADNLTTLANVLTLRNQPDLNQTAEELKVHAATLWRISNNTVNNMSSTVRNLTRSLNVLQENENLKTQVDDLLKLASNAEDAIQTRGKEIIKETINKTADEVKEVLNEAINSAVNGLKNNVGKCRVLYSSLETLHGTICKTVLYPFNGFWYSIGWCLFFFIPSIIFAMLLAGQYRKTEEYDPKRDDFDHSNYEEDYQGAFPGDHIALDDMSRRRGKQERNGVSNAGYDDRRGGGGGGYPYNSGGGGGDRYDDNRYKGTPSGGYGRGYDGYHDNRSYGGGYGGRGSYDRSDSYVEPVAPPSYHAAAYGNHWQNNRHY